MKKLLRYFTKADQWYSKIKRNMSKCRTHLVIKLFLFL